MPERSEIAGLTPGGAAYRSLDGVLYVFSSCLGLDIFRAPPVIIALSDIVVFKRVRGRRFTLLAIGS
jgi:hypothetical protein